jgi:hypothetical protein
LYIKLTTGLVVFGNEEFRIPLGFVDSVGEIVCCVNNGRVATEGDIASFCFGFLLKS